MSDVSRQQAGDTTATAPVDDGASSRSSAPLSLPLPLRSHVQVASGHLPVAPLTGRAHQRFHEGRRLVCGGCCFRVDVMPAEQTDKAAAADAEPSDVAAHAAAAAAGRVQLSVLLVRSKKRDEFIWPKGGWEKVSAHTLESDRMEAQRRRMSANDAARTGRLHQRDRPPSASAVERTVAPNDSPRNV